MKFAVFLFFNANLRSRKKKGKNLQKRKVKKKKAAFKNIPKSLPLWLKKKKSKDKS